MASAWLASTRAVGATMGLQSAEPRYRDLHWNLEGLEFQLRYKVLYPCTRSVEWLLVYLGLELVYLDKPIKSVTRGQCADRPTTTFPAAGHL